MQIYQAEKDAGLSELLSAKSSIVYASLAEKSVMPEPTRQKLKENQAFAGVEDSDLYYTQSILVTTSWNKNDDIFDPAEVWVARDTPTHKPTNLEHNENLIVGHITSNWPIQDNGEIIPEHTPINNLPNKFHILTGSVIYRGFTEPELKNRANELIDEIEHGDKYVSMECFFKGFDYGLINKSTGEFRTLSRNEETAFLTKYLRAYGGLGEHENYKIGRVLRQITFSGKGFVNKPANPESVIFTKDALPVTFQNENNEEKKHISPSEGVSSNQANLKETTMSVETEVVELVADEAVTVVETETVTEVVAPAAETEAAQPETVQTESAVKDSLEEEQTEKEDDEKEDDEEEEKEEAAKKMSEDKKKKDEEAMMMKMKADLDEALSKLQAANEAIAAYKMKEDEMAKKEKKNKRTMALIKNGVNKEMASSTVDKFESLDDAQFENMTALLATVHVPATEVIKASEDVVENDDVSAALETVETDQNIDLSVGSENESETQNTRAALVDFVCLRLGKKLNKGE